MGKALEPKIKIKIGKILAIIFLLFIILFCFYRCRHIKTVDELIKYANSKYGDCEFVNAEEGDDYNRCTFIDKKYGFEYYVESYYERIGGLNSDSTIGHYATVRSNYEKTYYDNYLSEKSWAYGQSNESILSQNGMTVRYNESYKGDKKMTLAWIDGVSERNADIAEQWAKSYMDNFFREDDKSIFKKVNVMLRDTNRKEYKKVWLSR